MYGLYNLEKKSKKTGELFLTSYIKVIKIHKGYSEMQNNVSSIGFAI